MSLIQLVKKSLCHRLFVKIVLCFCLCVIMILHYSSITPLTSTSFITYNYPLASQGKYPNGIRLDVYQIVSEEVLQETIDKSGLHNHLTVNEFKKMISVYAKRTKVPEDGYIATEYGIRINMKEQLNGVRAEGLLKQLFSAYSKHFYQNFTYNQSIFSLPTYTCDIDDYRTLSASFSTKANLLHSYVTTRMSESKSFISEDTGESFSSLQLQINDFNAVILDKYNAYIANYGLNDDYDKFLAETTYKINQMQRIYDENMIGYQVRHESIKDYQTEQSAIVMIPTRDPASEFYMSKTKIGMDYLFDAAIQNMSTANQTLASINSLNNLLQYAKSSMAGGNLYDIKKEADNMVASMTSFIEQLEKTIKKTDDEFIHNNYSNLLLFKVPRLSTMEIYGIKNVFVYAVFFYILMSSISFTILHRKRVQRKEIKHAKL